MGVGRNDYINPVLQHLIGRLSGCLGTFMQFNPMKEVHRGRIMKWLVTFKKQIDRKKILEQLSSLQCEVVTSDHPIPLGTDEETMSVEGPNDLAKLAEPFSSLIKVYPNSKMSAYRKGYSSYQKS